MCAQVWSDAGHRGRHLGGLDVSEMWVASAARNAELSFGRHSFVQSFSVQEELWGADWVSKLVQW